MIDCNNFKKIYEKMLQENHNLVIEKLAQVTGADANRIQEKMKELGFNDLSYVSQEDFDKIVNIIMMSDKDKKAPIKDENVLNEQDPNEEETDETNLNLLYNVINLYHQAVVKNNQSAKDYLKTVETNPTFQTLEKKYSNITSKSDIAKTQDEKNKTNMPLLNNLMSQLYREIIKDKRTNNP